MLLFTVIVIWYVMKFLYYVVYHLSSVISHMSTCLPSTCKFVYMLCVVHCT